MGLRDRDVSRLFVSLSEFHRGQGGGLWHGPFLRLSLPAAAKSDGSAGLAPSGRDHRRLGPASMVSSDLGERTLCRRAVYPAPQGNAVSLSLGPVSAVLRHVCARASTAD